MKIRDATAGDLPAIVGIYNSAVPTRLSTADTEPVSVEDRAAWFHAHDPSHRPLWVTEDGGETIGWLSLGDFYDGRPAYHATAEVGVYVSRQRLVEKAIGRAHNEASVALFEGFGFETWARFPKVAEIDGVERDLLVLGLRLDRDSRERGNA